MANFNPGINPTNDPDYTRSSKGADVLDSIKPQGQQANSILPEGPKQGDLSAQYAGQAIAYGMQAQAAGDKQVGDIFASIVQGADYLVKTGDSLVKQSIDRKVYDTVNAEREREITRLDSIARGAVSTAAGSTNQSLMDANASMDVPPDVPEEVQNDVERTVNQLAGIKENTKLKIDYYGRQSDAAKELRMQYPGYAEYIDDRFKKVLGTDPANAKLTQLVNSINQNSNAMSQERNRVISALEKSGMPGADGLMRRYFAGQLDANSIFLAVTKHNSNIGVLNQYKLELSVEDASLANRQQKAQRAFDFNINTSVVAEVNGLTFNLGIDHPVSFKEFNDNLNNWDPKQIEIANGEIGKVIAQLKQRWVADSTQPVKDSKGNLIAPNGVTDLMGGTKVRDEKIAQGIAYLTELQKGLRDKDLGPAFGLIRQLEAQYSQTKAGLRALPGIGTTMDISKALNEAGLDPKMYALSNLSQRLIDTELQPYNDKLVMEMKAQSALRNTGKPTTGNTILDNMAENKIKDPTIVDNIIKEAVGMASPDMPDEIKKNLNAAMFSKENRGFVSRLNKDGVDSRGNFVPGQWYTFAMLTDDKVAQAMYKLGGNYWANYKNWTEGEFRNIFTQHIKELNSITYGKGIQVMWDSEHKEFDVFSTSKPRSPEAARAAGGANASQDAYLEAKATINKINAGLKSLNTIGSLTGKQDEVDKYLLRTLSNSGWSAAERTKGLPADMAKAIMNASEEDLRAKAQKGVLGDRFTGVNQ